VKRAAAYYMFALFGKRVIVNARVEFKQEQSFEPAAHFRTLRSANDAVS